MWEDGLKKDTLDVFDVVSKMECIKNLYLCGGTGISLQIQNRFSEDLNFELLNYKGEIKNLIAYQKS
jgi:Tfp pilus assembly PilM family ATPase